MSSAAHWFGRVEFWILNICFLQAGVVEITNIQSSKFKIQNSKFYTSKSIWKVHFWSVVHVELSFDSAQNWNSNIKRTSFFRGKKKGVKVVKDIFEEEDEFGKVRFAIVQTYGETTHTFIERHNYKGLFLPGYKAAKMKDCLLPLMPDPGKTVVFKKSQNISKLLQISVQYL